jgi:prevent-host-death family protein
MAESTARTVSATVFMRDYGRLMDEVRINGRTVIVASHGRPQVAVVPIGEYDALVEARRQLAWTRLARLTGEPAKEEGKPT